MKNSLSYSFGGTTCDLLMTDHQTATSVGIRVFKGGNTNTQLGAFPYTQDNSTSANGQLYENQAAIMDMMSKVDPMNVATVYTNE